MSRTFHADVRDREREQLVTLGLDGTPRRPGMKAIARRARLAVVRAYRTGAPIDQAISRALDPARDLLTNGMVASHLQGRLRSHLTYKAAARDRRVLSDPFRAAIDFLERRMDLNPSQIVDLADEYSNDVDTAVRALGGDLNQKVNAALAEAAGSGLHVNAGVARLREAFDAAGMGDQSDAALQTLYRTQVQTAYSAGQWNANQDPAIQEILWGYTYTTVGDDRVRPTHAAMDGTRAPKDSPLWESWFPPCGYNCRCTAIEIFVDDQDAKPDIPTGLVSIDGVLVRPGPDKGWDFNPGELYRDALGLLGAN